MNALIFNSNNGACPVVKNAGAWTRLLFICAFICVATIAARAQNVPSTPIENSTLSWSLQDGTLTISGTGDMPDYGGGDSPWYSYQSSITDVVIADGVTSIGNWAFGYCSSLTSVAIPNSVISIGYNIFALSSLTTVTVPNSVTSIKAGAFGDCMGLTSIDVDINNTTYTSEDGVIFNKSKTTLVAYPAGKAYTNTNYTIPNSVTSIGDNAFQSCFGLSSVTIPNSVMSIGVGAFSNCQGLISVNIPNSVMSIGQNAFYVCSSLTSVTIPNSVTSIGQDAFSFCNRLTSISVDNANAAYFSENGVLFSKDKTILIHYPAGKTDAAYVIPNSVMSIENAAFAWCNSLTSVTIPNSVTAIKSSAFDMCSSLASITIPNSDIFIEGWAFAYCYGLTEITNYATTPKTIDASVFIGVDISSITLRVPLGSTAAYRTADVWKDFGNIVEFVADPHYTAVVQPYPENMTVTAAVVLNGAESQSDHIEIGAFCGGECRGSAVLKNCPANTDHPYLGFMIVNGNDGDNIVFKVFNHDNGKEYDAINNAPVSFTADAINGDPASPYMITVSDVVTQTIPLSAGWSWVSVNITGGSPSLLDQFKESVGDAGNLLKGRNEFIQTPGWIGTLQGINNGEMYMVNTNAASSLSFTGLPADPAYTPISLLNGWNWIGYVPQTSMLLDEALAGLTPQDGDQIKSHDVFSSYVSGTGWVNNLEMNPGEGYKYYSQNTDAQTLVYPSTSSQFRSSSSENDVPLKWTANTSSFPNTMTMTSIVLSGNTELQSDQIEIGAFSGEECRGSAMLKNFPQLPAHPYLGFLVVYGSSNEAISFKIYNHATGQENDASNASLSFASDAIYGSPTEPFAFVFSSPTGISGAQSGDVAIFLDSSGDNLNIRYPWNVIDQVQIVDLSGRIVWQTTGFASKSVNVSPLAKGAYVLKLVKDNQVSAYKFVKK